MAIASKDNKRNTRNTKGKGINKAVVSVKGINRNKTAIMPKMAPDAPITGIVLLGFNMQCNNPDNIPDNKKIVPKVDDPIFFSKVEPTL
jgi:hypothetical protein